MKTSELFHNHGLNFQDFKTPNAYGNNYEQPPDKPGIYLIVGFDGGPDGNQIVAYVGSSHNLAKRYKNHAVLREVQSKMYYATFFFKECGDGYEAEKELVRRIRPTFNSHMYVRREN